eukprot:9488418-Pyramimonas_sp.AAC.1
MKFLNGKTVMVHHLTKDRNMKTGRMIAAMLSEGGPPSGSCDDDTMPVSKKPKRDMIDDIQCSTVFQVRCSDGSTHNVRAVTAAGRNAKLAVEEDEESLAALQKGPLEPLGVATVVASQPD